MTDTETAPARPGDGVAGSGVYQAIRAQARSAGDAVALLDESDSLLDYATLVDRAEGLAGALRAHRGDQAPLVAAALDSPADSVVAMLAVLAAGGVYCPVDVTAPASRTSAIVRRLGVRVAVARDAHAGVLGPGVRVVAPDTTSPGTFVPARPNPDSPAYALHTSGSTGEPKAVAMTHRGLDRLVAWQVADGPGALRTLQFTAASFDVTFQETLSTLATGGCLVVAPDEARRNPDVLLDTIIDRRIERLFLPYVALQLLASSAARRSLAPEPLRHVITAGERLIVTPEIRALFSAIPRCRLDNHYGPTEAHLVTAFTLAGPPDEWPEVPPIGAPVAGVSCRILDRRLRPVRDGDVGECYVSGSGVALGYLGDPGRSAERFVADPFTPGGRLYRTGDQVRAGAHGYEFVGRLDDQLKVRGFRVEPAEVESALLHHPLVDAAAVTLQNVTGVVPALVGYVQAAGEVSHRDLTAHLRDRLPAYMIPKRFVTVPRLPRTSSGKIDRSALAAFDVPAPADVPAGRAASVIDSVTAIWRRVLGHDEFDADDDFFDVGGDSILATWAVTELAQELGCPVGLSVFLDHSTPAELAAVLAGQGPPSPQERRPSQLVTLRPGPSARSLYLVHPLGGELIGYRELVRALRAPFRLLGISWTGAPPAFGSTLEDIAGRHVEQLRSIEPDGPYRLAGWSFGGVLAYEMARRLREAGAVVDFLGLLDANPVIDPLTGLPMARTPFLGVLDAVVARLDAPAGAGDLEALTSEATWTQLMGAAITDRVPGDSLRTVLDTARACMNAAMEYDPRSYDGPVTLFQACGGGADRQARLAAELRKVCTGPFTVVPLAGDHRGLMRGPHVAETAAELDAALERAGTEGT